MFYKIKDYFREISDYISSYNKLIFLLNNFDKNLKKKIIKVINKDFIKIKNNIDCPHYGSDVLSFVNTYLKTRLEKIDGVIVEAGVYTGGLTSKMSLILDLFEDTKYFCFDTFEGMPKNNENHIKDIYGRDISKLFNVKEYHSSFENTKKNIKEFGNDKYVIFKKGLFENTMKDFNDKISILYIDCDLAESTKTTLKNLYHNVTKGGYIISQDAHIPLVIDLLKNDDFWNNDLGVKKPDIQNLGKKRLIIFKKDY
jgi:O-methyltransferase